MRSAVITALFLFSLLFLGAQAAQMGPPQPIEEAAAMQAQQADAGLYQQAGYAVPTRN